MEKSCGAVLYKTVDGVPYYVLVLGSVFGFPKGHVEGSETEEETAAREIKEETGVDAVLDTGFRRVVEYRSPRKRGGRKTVVFFLARYGGDVSPRAGHEIKGLVVRPYEQAKLLLRHEALRSVLHDADEYIRAQALPV
ncbi:MAG: NUDIX domain-containing protein [Clostridia bacterium]|nr:NUDIX domain-containing protein [Clostridia bacterium]